MKKEIARLQFITHHNERYDYYDSARLALEGGIRWIQLRMTGEPAASVRATAVRVQQLCRQYDATFLIDDEPGLVAELQADGVHIEYCTQPLSDVRRLVGDDCIIGGTGFGLADMKLRHAAGCDYCGCGPYRVSTTKLGLSGFFGLDGYRDLTAGLRQAGIAMPVVAVAGILQADVAPLLTTGVHGIALSGAIMNAPDPVEAARQIVSLFASPR